MLLTLTARNLALIDSVTVEFGPGLHVLTGETGAGKSLVVDAVGLLLGGKADKTLIRDGAEKAYAEGIFDLRDSPRTAQALREADLGTEEGELILSREISVSGRSVCRVNGVAVPLALYHSLGEGLIDLHGQHQHQSLLSDRNHIQYLDDFGDETYAALCRETAQSFAQWQEADRALRQLREQARGRQDREEILRLRRRELKNAAPKAGEEEALEKERDRIRNAGKITGALREGYEALYDGGGAALSRLKEASDALSRVASYDGEYAALSSRLESVYYEAEDISYTLSQKLDGFESDPEREEAVLSRLDLLRRLSRKYGTDAAGLADTLRKTEEELESLSSLDEDISAAEDREKKADRRFREAAKQLGGQRTLLAERFENAVEAQLRDLNMAGTRFRVQVEQTPPSPRGLQNAVFLIAPNRGEKLQPLSKTASGGELSRLMLAIKAASAEKSYVPSMVFDEIDTGISGRAAQTTAEKMAAIARTHQVLCVTHLQQIAAMADRQYLVEKVPLDGRTVSRVRLLDAQARQEEIARMLGGERESARKHAAEMLRGAEEIKKLCKG